MHENCRLTNGRCQMLRAVNLEKIAMKISQSFPNCDTVDEILELQIYRDYLLKIAGDMKKTNCEDCPNINQST